MSGTKDKVRGKQAIDVSQLVGKTRTINSQTIRVLTENNAGSVLLCSGTVTVTDGGAGYAKGALYIKTDVGAGTSGLYENIGSITACNFDLIGSGGGGVTTFVALTDVPGNYTADANKILKVNNGETAVEFVTVSGDAAMSSAGVFTVTDLTITGEVAGNMLYFDGANWVRLASGTNLYVLQYQTASNAPVWTDPATLPTGIASGLSSSFTMEGGANDIVHAVTAQTVGSPTLTIPDFANVDDTYVFVTLAQTLANKTLTSPVLTTPQINDASSDHQYIFAVNELAADRTVTLPLLLGNDVFVFADFIQTLTNKTLTSPVLTTPQINDTSSDHQYVFAVSELAADRTVTLPQLLGNDVFVFADFVQTLTNKTLTTPVMSTIMVGAQTVTLPEATDTLVGKATTDTFTNKTFDCDAAGNALSNVNANELDPVTPAAAAIYAVPFIFAYSLTNQAAAVDIYNANAPFKFRIIRAWSIATSADGGTWKLNNGAAGAGTDITNAVTVAASDQDIDEPTDYDNAAYEIAANGSLSIVPDGAGLLDCDIYIQAIRVN